MVNYRYLGYGVTNDNGVATLDYDANGDPLQSSGLVGTGAGKLDVVASLDDLSGITITPDTSTINDTGSTYTLSATVTNNNVAVNNETVCFELYKVSDGSLVDTLTGVTNSSGVVTVSYLGIGAGSLYIKVRMLQSETYAIVDGYIAHDGVTDKNIFGSPTLSRTYDASGTTMSNTSSSDNYAYIDNTEVSGTLDWTQPICLEFDLVNFTSNATIYIGNTNYQDVVEKYFQSELNASNNNHIKLVYKNNNIKIVVDETEKVSVNKTYNTNVRIGFRVKGGSGSFTYKNLVLYPI